MRAAQSFSEDVSTLTACTAMAIPRASFYRWQKRQVLASKGMLPAKRSSKLGLSAFEKQTVLDTLNAERFVDQSPGEVYATLLDEGQYLCSERTMYRLLAQANAVRERRRIRRQSGLYAKPELGHHQA